MLLDTFMILLTLYLMLWGWLKTTQGELISLKDVGITLYALGYTEQVVQEMLIGSNLVLVISTASK